eukprot:4722148-Pyramimonas_sp.AAC.1
MFVRGPASTQTVRSEPSVATAHACSSTLKRGVKGRERAAPKFAGRERQCTVHPGPYVGIVD